MKFKKGDILATKNAPVPKPMAKVTSVTRDGIVHCVNLVACSTMNEGDEFHFTQSDSTWYEVHSRE